jgi:hypothetical protein
MRHRNTQEADAARLYTLKPLAGRAERMNASQLLRMDAHQAAQLLAWLRCE